MCYSQGMSMAMAAIGWSMVALMIVLSTDKRKRAEGSLHPVVVPLAFYSLMETLQAAQYSWLDQCGDLLNYGSTVVAHVLVAVQPLMWNVYRLEMARRSDDKAHRRKAPAFRLAAIMSLLWAVFFTLRLAAPGFTRGMSPFPSAATYKTLRNDEIMVGPQVCTLTSPMHLVWNLPYYSSNGLEANFFAYLLLWFVPALHEPRGLAKMAFWLSQVMFVNWTVASIHELPTVWCALSVPILALIVCLEGPRLGTATARARPLADQPPIVLAD
ncbi:putative membrane protein [Mollivirus sibericum]|uniref:hypothetical protein n=1 Tax=Mollivirus sibericum TaxID=1678078 RepID=UPI0006B2E985|nr:hypothetical protein ml_215 [Mollivirus sibericum]ALD62017.1 putative membrane protein [Mollivirus sibericum]